MYQRSKIYKITSNQSDNIYIGSTCNPLYKRLGQHKSTYKEFINGKTNNCTSFELIKLGDAIITLIEDYPCESKEQLRARERYYIELNKDICVNKVIPTRTCKEYYQTNKETIEEQQKEYREANKKKIKEQQKKYKNANKEKIVEYNQQKITCECGNSICIFSKAKHERSKKHQQFIQQQ